MGEGQDLTGSVGYSLLLGLLTVWSRLPNTQLSSAYFVAITLKVSVGHHSYFRHWGTPGNNMVHRPSVPRPPLPAVGEKQPPAEAAQEAAGRSRGGSIAGAGWSTAAATGAGGRHRVRGVHEQGGDHVEEQAPVSYPYAGTTQERRARLSLDDHHGDRTLRWGGSCGFPDPPPVLFSLAQVPRAPV